MNSRTAYFVLGMVVGFLIGLFVNVPHADAAEAPVGLPNCSPIEGTTSIEEPPVGQGPIEYDFSSCDIRGMRVWQGIGHGKSEYKNAKVFAELTASPREPQAVCGGRRSSYTIDLTYTNVWVGDKNKAERQHYKTWVTRYAKRHHCKLYNENWEG